MLRAYGDGNLFGEAYGDEPARVVWLHGWARRGQDFAVAASQLAEEGVGSVALDLPGFGSSPLPTVAGGARHYAHLLIPALREISQRPIVLVGHSFGGCVATVIAAEHPDLVRSLVLTGAPLIRSTARAASPWSYRVVRWLHAHGVVGAEPMERARQRYGSADYRHAHGLLREVLVASVNESYEDEVARVESPIWMVWGENDREVPVNIARRAAALVRSPPSLRLLHGVGHLVPTETPGELVASVREALA